MRRWHLILPYFPFAAAAVVSAAQVVAGAQIGGVQAIILLIGFALIMIRQLLTLVHNSKLTEELRFQAFHDPLTGLGNRALFTDRLEDVLARGRTGGSPTVLYLDLDDFKLINDTLGHDAGDALLCAVADRLRNAFRQADAIARLGGDEFVVLLTRAGDPAAEAQRMLDHPARPVRDRLAHGRGHRQRRRRGRDRRAGPGHLRGPAQERGPGDVRGQGARQERVRRLRTVDAGLLRRRDGAARGTAPRRSPTTRCTWSTSRSSTSPTAGSSASRRWPAGGTRPAARSRRPSSSRSPSGPR